MNKIKYALAAGGLSAALTLGFAAPVAAQNESGPGDNNSNTTTVEVDASRNVNGDCSAIQEQNVYQDQTSVNVQENEVEDDSLNAEVEGLLNIGNDPSTSNSQSNSANTSQNQSNNQSFEADCSQVTNVTEVAQVEAPEGGVEAGAGGAAGSALGSLLGLGGSAGSLGYGILRLRKRA